MHGTRPFEHARKQFEDNFSLGLRLQVPITTTVRIVGLIPHVPAKDPIVLCESSEDTLHISFKARIFRLILERLCPGALHPAGIVDAGARVTLLAELRIRVPAGIEQNKKRFDVVFRRDLEKGIDTLAKSFRVLLPRKIMEKNAHGVEADGLCPAKLEVDALGIEGICLPHLEFIDCSRGNVVAPHEPRLLCVPIVGGLLRPARGLRRGSQLSREEITKHDQKANKNFLTQSISHSRSRFLKKFIHNSKLFAIQALSAP